MEKLRCPSCQNDLSFLSFLKAATPWHMKCGKCGVKLQQDKSKWLSTLVIFIVGFSLGLLSAHMAIGHGYTLLGILILLVGYVAFEFFAFKLLPKLKIGLEIK